MMKQLTFNMLVIVTAFFNSVCAQVGVNTTNPQATFDVTGKPTIASSLDGFIPPRITGDQLRAKTYTTAQTGAIIYVTTADSAPAGQTINVIGAGYYYFDGAVWQALMARRLPTSQLILLVRGTGSQLNTPSPAGNSAKLAYFSNSATKGGFTDIINDPGSWDPAKQVYTAPVSGTYQIAMNVLMHGCSAQNGDPAYVRTIVKSGSTYMVVNTSDITQNNGFVNNNQFTTINLKANDQVFIDYLVNPTGALNNCTNTSSNIHRLAVYRFQ
ncbi:hypothetical protein [Chryseobacterium wanjuense]